MMARIKDVVFLLTILSPMVSDFQQVNSSTKAQAKEVNISTVSELPGRDVNDSETSDWTFKSESNANSILPLKKNYTKPTWCNASIRDIKEKSVEFAKLLSEKMTHFVEISVIYVRKDKSNQVSTTAVFPETTLIWINNAIGMTAFSLTCSRPQNFVKLASFGTLMVGKKEFNVHVEEEPQRCFENANPTSTVELLLEEMLSKREKSTSYGYFVNYQPNRPDSSEVYNVKACATLKQFGYVEVRPVDYMIVLFCLILSPLVLVRLLAFFDNQTEERLRVPHNFILCKILRKLCCFSIVPKLVFLIVCSYCLILKWFETSSISYLILVIVFFLTVSVFVPTGETDSYAFEEKFFDLLIPSYDNKSFANYGVTFGYSFNLICILWNSFVKVHNVAFQPCSTFSYCDMFNRSDVKNFKKFFTLRPFEDFLRILGTLTLMVVFSVSSLSFISVVKYTLLGLLLNHDEYLPLASLCIIVAFYAHKSFQSFCEDYSFLLIKVFNVCEEAGISKDMWEYKEGIPAILPELYEEVRRELLPYGKSVFKLTVQGIFIVSFASLIFDCCKFLEDTNGVSFNVKVVAMFSLTILPYIIKICYWEQKEEEKLLWDKARSKLIENIVVKYPRSKTGNGNNNQLMSKN